MKYLKVRNTSRRVDLGHKVRVAHSLWDRTIGLLSTPSLDEGEGLWLSPCKSIHTFFMKFPIDVLFLDGEGIVLHRKTYKPWRFSSWHAHCRGVLELPAGTLRETHTQVGDHIDMKGLN